MRLVHDKNAVWGDWRTGNAYPVGERVSVEQWAWEFLRRNPEYIDDWNQYVAEFALRKWGRSMSVEEIEETELKQQFLLLQMLALLDGDKDLEICDPPLAEGETEEAWRERVGLKARKRQLHRKYAHRWGLLSMINPASGTGYLHFGCQPLVCFKTSKDGKLLSHGSRGTSDPLHTQAQCAVEVTFNLEVSLEGQLEFLREILEREKKYLLSQKVLVRTRELRIRADRYRNLLRVLDADALGVGARDIGAVLYSYLNDGIAHDDGRTKLVRGQLRAAKALRDDGYRRLLGENQRIKVKKK